MFTLCDAHFKPIRATPFPKTGMWLKSCCVVLTVSLSCRRHASRRVMFDLECFMRTSMSEGAVDHASLKKPHIILFIPFQEGWILYVKEEHRKEKVLRPRVVVVSNR